MKKYAIYGYTNRLAKTFAKMFGLNVRIKIIPDTSLMGKDALMGTISYDNKLKDWQIHLNMDALLNAQDVDRVIATRLLRHGVAHEVGHIRQFVLTGKPFREARDLWNRAFYAMEHEANVFAKWASGLSEYDAVKTLDLLNKKALFRYGRPLFGEHGEVW
jgi:hypothetical protein